MNRDQLLHRIGLLEDDLAALRAMIEPSQPTQVVIGFNVRMYVHVDCAAGKVTRTIVEMPNCALAEVPGVEVLVGEQYHAIVDDDAVRELAFAITENTLDNWPDVEMQS